MQYAKTLALELSLSMVAMFLIQSIIITLGIVVIVFAYRI
jgi:hypothetical protein